MRSWTRLAGASSEDAGESKTLWVIPNSSVSKEEVWQYLDDWAVEAVDEGSAVNVESRKDEGVTFTFKSSANSYLALDVVSMNIDNESSRNSIEIVSRLVLNRDESVDAGITTLITMIAQNLIDSLCNDIGNILMSKPDENVTGDNDGAHQKRRHSEVATEVVSEPENACITDAQFEQQLERMQPLSSSNEVSKIDLEGSLSIDSSVRGSTYGYSGVIAQRWSNLAAGQEVVVANYIRSWTDQKFANRGAGIEATDIPFGVKLTFAISELLHLRLRVHCEFYDARRIKDLYALAELVVADDDNFDENTEGKVYDLSARINDEKNAVSTVARNVATAFRDDVSSLLLEPAEYLSDASEEHFSQKLRDEEIIVAGERPILGDLGEGNDAARSVVRAEQKRISVGKGTEGHHVHDNDLRSRLKQFQSQRAHEPKASATFEVNEDPELDNIARKDKSDLEGSGDEDEHVRDSILNRKRPQRVPTKLQQQQEQQPSIKHDPYVQERAWQEGVKLESFEGRGLEEQAMRELQEMLQNSQKKGFLAVLKEHKEGKMKDKGKEGTSTNEGAGVVDVNTEQDLEALMQEGANHCARARGLLEQQHRKEIEKETLSDQAASLLGRNNRASQREDLGQPGTAFPMDLERAGFSIVNSRSDPSLRNGPNDVGPEGTDLIDIFQGPLRPEGVESQDPIPAPVSSIAGQLAAKEASRRPPNPETIDSDDRTLQLLVNELLRQPVERHGEVLQSYKDLLLSDNLLYLLHRDNDAVRDHDRRAVYKEITDMAQEAVLEVGALVKSESVRHLETIMKVCEVAALYQHNEVEFLDRMEPLRAYFDTTLLGYLDYAIQEEEAGIKANGGDPLNMPSRWLSVLRLVQKGVLAEFENRFDRLLEPLLLTVRFEQPDIRAVVFSRFVNITAAVDLPYMRQLGINMVEGVEQKVSMGEVVDPVLVASLKNFKDDCLERFLSEEIVEEKLSAFRAEIESQGRELVVRKRHPLVQAQIDDANEERRKRGLPPLSSASSLAGEESDIAKELDMLGQSITHGSRTKEENPL